MAKIAKWTTNEFAPSAFLAAAQAQAIIHARDEFVNPLKLRFIDLASQIEQWDDPDNEAAIIVRLKDIVDNNSTFTQQQLLNMGCILIALYNFVEE